MGNEFECKWYRFFIFDENNLDKTPRSVNNVLATNNIKSAMQFFRKKLFQVARSDFAGAFIGFGFEYLSALIPVKKIVNNSKVIAFDHPSPYWEEHILLIPKKSIRSIGELKLDDNNTIQILSEIFSSVQDIIRDYQFENYTLMVNGGSYQDVPQIHFHLGSGTAKNTKDSTDSEYKPQYGEILFQGQNVSVCTNLSPQRETDILFVLENCQNFLEVDFRNNLNQEVIRDLFSQVQRLFGGLNLKAYSLQFKSSDNKENTNLTFRFISGARY